MTDSAAQHTLAERIAALRRTDREFAEAIASPTVAQSMMQQNSLFDTISAALTGYSARPALAQRARRIVEDQQTGRRVLELLPSFEAVSYGELWRRVVALGHAWLDGLPGGYRVGDFVATIGFTSIDYATVDLACMLLAAVSVPLPIGSPADQLMPIIDETAPRILAASIESVETAVDVVLQADSVQRLMVFDYDDRVDDQRERFEAAATKLAGRVAVVDLRTELQAGQGRPVLDPRPDHDPDRLAALVYTSGSTGTPKGVMYSESRIAMMWQSSRSGLTNAGASERSPLPTFVLHYMPMSHVNGRSWLVAGLASGGIGYFTARSDMSTLFEDIALARPTVLSLVPRICDMVFQRYQIECERRSESQSAQRSESSQSAQLAARAEIRDRLLGGRIVSALCGSAPLSQKMQAFMESILGTTITDCYGSTETGRPVVVNQQIRRPPVIDYQLVDVPELGYFRTDKPYPRGELRLKSVGLFPGYYRQPEITAGSFDELGYYRTGDVMAEVMADRLIYVDRINNVLKLSQGEFVAISRLEALYSTSPYIEQIYVYGSSEQAFLLAVVVPDYQRIGSADTGEVRTLVSESMRQLASEAGLNSYEIPQDFLIEPHAFTAENGLLSGVGKLLRPALKARYGDLLEQRYAQIAAGRVETFNELRAASGSRPTRDTVAGAAEVTLGSYSAELRADTSFTELGGDSLSAHTFSTVLEQVFGIEVPVQVIIGPTATLQSIAEHVDAARGSQSSRPTAASVHGLGSTRVSAAELSLDKFIDSASLARAATLPMVAGPARTVLLTGATGYLGRFLCLEWLQRLADTGGKLICIARGRDDDAARQRIAEAFDSGPAELDEHFSKLAGQHLEVLAGDTSAPRLGLSEATWDRLAASVDQIVHAAALVNHVLPYAQLFGPNVAGTAELIRLALTGRRTRFTFISTVAVAMLPDGSFVGETADIRQASAARSVDESYANGYATSKWAAEVLLREAHDLCGLPVAVFRPDMILAHSHYACQLNVSDRFTRLLLSVLATGLAPRSFYALDEQGNRQRAHYSGLPVDFTAASITSLAERASSGYSTYHVVNAHDDGVSLDQFVDWLVERGYPITRIDDYQQWRSRFEIALKSLPDRQRKHSMLPLMHAHAEPAKPAAMAPAEQFQAAVRAFGVCGGGVPRLTAELIEKYVLDLQRLALLAG
jgi:fatty acid CoA ligase FadD9